MQEYIFDRERIAAINAPLLAWYAREARALPWRDDPTGYHVWVSEIMLQQTRVEAVRPYYARFLEALPTISDLATCREDRLLKLWEGLGYYSRVRNMQRCAQVLERDFGGELPETYEALIRLPGIGPYTAGAISSIAFAHRVPAVDGNVMRVVSRVVASREDILLPATRKRIDAALRDTMPGDAFLESAPGGNPAGAFNQAMMDLGAAICLPGAKARCPDCPLQAICLCHAGNLTQQIPVRIVKTRRTSQARTVLVIRDGRHTVLGKRENKGLLAGLYELPNLEGTPDAQEVLAFVRALGISPLRIRPLPAAKHVFTHLDWFLSGYQIFAEDLTDASLCAGSYLVVPTDRIGTDYAIPSAFKAYLPFIHEAIT